MSNPDIAANATGLFVPGDGLHITLVQPEQCDVPQDTDEQLLLAFQQSRDPQHLEELVSRMQGPLIRYLYRIIWINDRTIVEDAIQDTFTTILEKGNLQLKGYNARQLLFGIARHKAFDILRRRRRKASPLVGIGRKLSDSIGLSAGDKEQHDRLCSAFSRLDPNHRTIIQLVYFEGHSLVEASKMLSISYATALRWKKSAVLQLRLLLKLGTSKQVSFGFTFAKLHPESELTQRALGALPDKQRQVLILTDQQGLTRERAAEALSIPPGTIASRVSRGRERLGVIVGQLQQQLDIASSCSENDLTKPSPTYDLQFAQPEDPPMPGEAETSDFSALLKRNQQHQDDMMQTFREFIEGGNNCKNVTGDITARQRTVLNLFYVQGWTTHEIEKQIGYDFRTVETDLSNIRKAVKNGTLPRTRTVRSFAVNARKLCPNGNPPKTTEPFPQYEFLKNLVIPHFVLDNRNEILKCMQRYVLPACLSPKQLAFLERLILHKESPKLAGVAVGISERGAQQWVKAITRSLLRMNTGEQNLAATTISE